MGPEAVVVAQELAQLLRAVVLAVNMVLAAAVAGLVTLSPVAQAATVRRGLSSSLTRRPAIH